MLRDSIDDVDALIEELTRLRQRLSQADLALAAGSAGADDALWDAENRLRGVAERAAWRARMVRRTIELFGEAPTA